MTIPRGEGIYLLTADRRRSERGTRPLMKRAFAVAALLTALVVLVKLTFKSNNSSVSVFFAPTTHPRIAVPTKPAQTEPNLNVHLLKKYEASPPQVRALVTRVTARYGRNAHLIERTDGLHGLVLLDRLDLEAIFLYEKHPAEFRRLCDLLSSDAAADLLLHWREYFGLKRADEIDRSILITEIASLSRGATTGGGAAPEHATADSCRSARDD